MTVDVFPDSVVVEYDVTVVDFSAVFVTVGPVAVWFFVTEVVMVVSLPDSDFVIVVGTTSGLVI